MSDVPREPWQPTKIRRWIGKAETSTGPARIRTDAGRAYLKALGNKEGEHALACEWIGTKLAHWFGLRTFDMAIMDVPAGMGIDLGHGRRAQPGPAVALREEYGDVWSGADTDLAIIDNPQDLAGLVVFDTWTRNCDRHPADATARKPNKDNVFLSAEGAAPGRFVVKAMDHTHCFTCGRELTRKLAAIAYWQDEGLYGLFPAFRRFMAETGVRGWAERLRQFDRAAFDAAVGALPAAWKVSDGAREALVEMLCLRARYVSDTIVDRVAAACEWPLPFNGERGGA